MSTFRSLLIVAVFVGLTLSSCKKEETTGPSGIGGPVTINGRVVSPARTPVPNVPVVIPGKPPVNTDASGRFSIPGVTPPYRIVVVNSANQQVYIFEGVTRTDPALTYLGMGVDSMRSASFSGVLHGGAYPQPANHTTVLAVESPDGPNASTTTTDSAFAVSFTWTGPASITGTVHALQWQRIGGLPSTYRGYGSTANVTLTNGGSVSGANISLSAPGDTTASGTVAIPAGYTQQGRTIGLRVGQTMALTAGSDPSTASAFNYIVPRTLLNPYLAVAVSAPNSAVSYYKTLSRGSGNAVTIPQAIQLTLPPNAASNVDTSTIFSWTPFSGAVYLAMFQGSGPTYFILTSGTSVSIPNLATIGYGLPASTSYTWGVYSFSPVAGVDGATGSAGYLVGLIAPPSGDGGYSYMLNRTFTTRP